MFYFFQILLPCPAIVLGMSLAGPGAMRKEHGADGVEVYLIR